MRTRFSNKALAAAFLHRKCTLDGEAATIQQDPASGLPVVTALQSGRKALWTWTTIQDVFETTDHNFRTN